MKTLKQIVLFVFCLAPFFADSQQADPQQILKNSDHNYFIENKGQWPQQVKYLARINGMNAWIRNEGVTYDYYRVYTAPQDEKSSVPSSLQPPDNATDYSRRKGQVINIALQNASKNAGFKTLGMLKGCYNYFIGNDPSKWASYVPLYNEVCLQDIYPGISIRYYFDKGLLRYDYIAQPGSDLALISLKITGADQFEINDKGELILATSVGNICHGKLYAYQKSDGITKEISCMFRKNANGSIGFLAENYDPALALVIDPLIYSTFIGGFDNDKGTSISVDISGFAYVAGYSESSNYPTVTGSYDLSMNGYSDIIVSKISTTGSGLEYSTFLGGNGRESATKIIADSNGNALFTGYTESTNYPTTSLAYEVTNKGGADVFITLLNSTGSALDYSTYIGGSNDDHAYSVGIDSIGNIYITGFTESANYPTTAAAYDVTHNGYGDVFITKFDPFYGYILAYSTFIGGTGYEIATSMAFDINGNVFVTGYTESSNYPTKFGSYDRVFNGVTDAFVTELDASGSNLIYSTFLGGGSFDYGADIALDNAGNTYITGYTESTAFPVTAGVFDIVFNGVNDVFVTKLNSAGSALVFSTFIGGSSDDYCYSIALDKSHNVYLTGATGSSNYPTSKGAYDASYNGSGDAFMSKLNSNGTNLTYSTFIGGTDDEASNGITLDNIGIVYITGATSSSNFPTTSGSFDQTHDLGYDIFATKILAINQATAIDDTNITSSGAAISWKKGDGKKRAVFVAKADSGFAFPVHFTTYTANKTFGNGTQIGSSGWYCVYNDTGSSVVVNGLSSNTTYRVMVCEYIGSSGSEMYNTDSVSGNPANLTTPYLTPSVQAKNISFSNVSYSGFTISCTRGNGSKRAVFVKSGSINSSIPVNNYTYTADTNFGSGSQIGTSGWYCVYNDTGTVVSVSNLLSSSTYCVSVYEYNGPASKEQYNTDTASGNPAIQITKYKTPDIQASSIIVTANATGSLTIKWTSGNGAKRAIFVKQDSYGIALPADNYTYKANDTFSKGTQINSTGWYCVYNDNGNSVKIKNLLSNSNYRIFVSEYNGTAGKEQYNRDSVSGNPVTQMTSYPTPTVQASNLSFSGISASGFTVKWNKGNGSARVLFVTDYNTGTPLPLNDSTYKGDAKFEAGSQIGSTGWFCVYNGTGDSVKVTGLTSLTTYRLMICEYNGTPGNERYLTTTATNNPSNQTTDYAKPTVQASDITFSNISATSVIFNYTRGNGTNCIILITEGSIPYPPLADNTTYTASSQIGTSGWYCKYNGNLNPTSITGLHPATWRMMICEYNGTAGSEKYNTDTASKNPNSFTNVGINDQLAHKIHIYPNPTAGQFIIENASGYYCTIYNCLGKEISSDHMKDSSFLFDLNEETDGMYLIKIEKDGQYFYQKILLKR